MAKPQRLINRSFFVLGGEGGRKPNGQNKEILVDEGIVLYSNSDSC